MSLLFCRVAAALTILFLSHFVKIQNRTPKIAAESDKNHWINVFKVKGSILSGINGNMPFSVKLFYLNICRIFYQPL